MKKPTCSVNNSECPLYHLSIPGCDENKSPELPCETDIDLEDMALGFEEYLKDQAEEVYTEKHREDWRTL